MPFSSKSQTFKLVVIRNPFEPTDRVIADAPCEGKSIKELLSQTNMEVAVNLSGREIAPEQYEFTYPVAGDALVICPMPLGGGGGKNIFRLIAIVALTVFTGGIAGGTYFGSLTSVQAGIVAAAVQIGGTLLINALLPPPVPKMDGFKMDKMDSPTYGIDGAKNTSTEGISVPLVYGTHRMAGNIIAMHSENDGNTQNLYMLINAGEGVISDIREIKINDQPLENFQDVEVQKRLGEPDQEMIGWFNQTVVPHSLGVNVTKNSPVIFDTPEEADAVRVDFVMPAGLVKINEESGSKQNTSLSFTISLESLDPDTPHSLTQNVTFTGKTQSALRRSVLLDDLPEARYRVTVTRVTADSESQFLANASSITDINVIIKEKIRYKNTALLAIKVRLTDQLNGIPNVSFLVEGIKVRVPTDEGFQLVSSDSPAWIVHDLMTKARYGGGIDDLFIDMEEFKRWAKFCSENGLTFNAVFDTTESLYDIVQPVLRAGHAKLVMAGDKFTVAVEKPDQPVSMFSQGNIIKDTFKIEWLPLSDRANEVQATYYDKDNDYKARTISVYDHDSLLRGDAQRLAQLNLVGVVDRETAYYEAELALKINRFIRQTVSFEASIDAIACTIGSVILVQHDMPKWGVGGRLQKSSTANVLRVAEELNGANRIAVMRSVMQRGTAVISNIVGNRVHISEVNLTVPGRLRRFKTGATEKGIVEYNTDLNYILVLSTEGLAVGQVLTLFDTDVVEERAFTLGTEGELILASPLYADPDEFAVYMAGEVHKYKKPFRVISISSSDALTREISAIEYNETVYTRDGTFLPTPVNGEDRGLKHSVITGIDEETVKQGGVTYITATVNFVNMDGRYLHSHVYVSKDSSPFALAGTGVNSVSFDVNPGQTVVVRVVAESIDNVQKDFATAPIISRTILGDQAKPSTPQYIRVQGGGVNFKTLDCPIEWQPSSNAATYNVAIKDNDGNVIGAGTTVEPRYVFTYSANTDRVRQFSVSVTAVSASGITSDTASQTLQNIGPTLPVISALKGYETIHFFTDRLISGANGQGLHIWVSEQSPVNIDAVPSYTGQGGSVTIGGLSNEKTYFYRAATFDHFGYSQVSEEVSLEMSPVGSKLFERLDKIDNESLEGSLADRVKNAVATIGASVKTFESGTAPVSTEDVQLKEGDLWFDTTNQNRPHRYNGSEWVELSDDRIAQLVTGLEQEVLSRTNADLAETRQRTSLASAHLATQNTGYRYFNQSATPTATQIGDVWTWINPTSGTETFRRWNGSSWVSTTSNKRAAVYYGMIATAPTTGLVIGDTYLDGSTGPNRGKILVWNGSSWVERVFASAELAAFIGKESLTRVTAESAIAQTVDQISTTVNDHSTAIMFQAESINGLSAQYTVQIDNNGFVSGYSLASGEGGISEFSILTNRFSIYDAADPTKLVLGVSDGQSYIRGAYIDEIKSHQIDTRGLTIRDANGNVIFGAGVGLDWGQIVGPQKPQNGATQNRVWRQTNQPVGTHGDIWVHTGVVPNIEYMNVNGVWHAVSSLGASFDPDSTSPVLGQINADNADIYLGDSIINSARIADVLESVGYVGDGFNRQGWRIYKSGAAYFQNIYARGLIEGSIIRGSVFEGGIFIGGTELTAATEADTGSGIRYLAYMSATTSGEASGSGIVTIPINLKSANFSGEGVDTVDEVQVYKNYNRYIKFLINPQISLDSEGPDVSVSRTDPEGNSATLPSRPNHTWYCRIRLWVKIGSDTLPILDQTFSANSISHAERSFSVLGGTIVLRRRETTTIGYTSRRTTWFVLSTSNILTLTDINFQGNDAAEFQARVNWTISGRSTTADRVTASLSDNNGRYM